MSNRNELIIKKTEKSKIDLDFSNQVAADDSFKQSTFALLIEQLLTFTSKKVGTTGNINSIEILDPGSLQASTIFALSVDKITLTLQHDGSDITATLDTVVADFASAPSAVIDLITLTGSGSGLMIASIEKSLLGGSDETFVTCFDVSSVTPIEAISKLTNLPVTMNADNTVELFFAAGEENHTYKIDVLNTTDNGSIVNKEFYVSIKG